MVPSILISSWSSDGTTVQTGPFLHCGNLEVKVIALELGRKRAIKGAYWQLTLKHGYLYDQNIFDTLLFSDLEHFQVVPI